MYFEFLFFIVYMLNARHSEFQSEENKSLFFVKFIVLCFLWLGFL